MSAKRCSVLLLGILLRHSVGFIVDRRVGRARLCGKKGWSEQEDALLVIAQDRWGAKSWERIMEVLPERTEREIRSRAKWRKTVKVPKNSGFSEFGARALGGFREEAATRATAIVDAAIVPAAEHRPEVTVSLRWQREGRRRGRGRRGR